MKAWRTRYGVHTEVFHVGWADSNESFNAKLGRLVARIDAAVHKGRRVSLIGSSAGGSMSVNALARRPKALHRVVAVAGALGSAEHSSPLVLAANPALKTSLERLPVAIASLPASGRRRILSVKPAEDRVVALEDMNIKGIHYLHLSTRGHIKTIASALTIHSAKLIRFILAGR